MQLRIHQALIERRNGHQAMGINVDGPNGANGAGGEHGGQGQGQGQLAVDDPCLRVPTEEALEKLYGAELLSYSQARHLILKIALN